MRIEPLSPADRDRCMDLAERVGWPRETAKWDVFFALGAGWCTRASSGALESMVAMPEHDGATFVAMMVVDPSTQGRGLGFALLSHAIAHAKKPVMLYATAQGRPLYERLGFVEVDRVRKLIGTPRARSSPSGRVRVACADDHDRIARQDARAFGADRRRMIGELLRRADRVVVDDDAEGFAIRWNNGHLDVVGPVVARHGASAIALVDAALEGVLGRARIDVVAHASGLAAHARALGLEELEGAPFMTWPERVLPGDRSGYHAIALQGLG